MIIGQSDTDYSRRILANDTALIRICGQCAVRRRSAESSARRLRRVGITADPHLTRTPLPATAATHSLSLISNVYHSSRCRNRNEAKRSFRSGWLLCGGRRIPQFVTIGGYPILDQSNRAGRTASFFIPFSADLHRVHKHSRRGRGRATNRPPGQVRGTDRSNHAAMWSINKGHGGGKLKGGSVWPSHHRLKP